MRRSQEGPRIVISFSVPEARNQLLNEGVVYTYRWTPRKRVGKDWANSKRGTKKITDVFIEDYGERACSVFDLGSFADKSGFKNVNEWIKKILEIANPSGYMYGHLYKVTRVSQQLGINHSPTKKDPTSTPQA